MNFTQKLVLSSLFFLMACANPYEEAKKVGTLEAYETFIKENPDSRDVFSANMEIETLLVSKARETQSVGDFDAYLSRFKENPPTKATYDKMLGERKDAFWNKALDTNKAKDWQAFIDEYNVKDPKKTRIAKQRLVVANYLPSLEMDPIEKIQVNLQGDDSGPLDGWEFSTQITNSGDKDIEAMRLRISFLDADGKITQAKDFTVIGCGDYCQRKFVFDDPSYIKQDPDIGRIKPPMKAGEKRDFVKTTGDIPPEWSKQLKATIVAIKFVSDENEKKK